jgi:hypothetical protein
MSRPSARITFSWTSTLKSIGAFLVMIVLGIVMTRADVLWVSLLGYLVTAVGGLGVLMIPFIGGVGKAPCPICSTILEVMGGTTPYVRCGACGEYFEAKSRVLRQMDGGHVAKTPEFAVRLPWDDLDSATSPTITLGNAQDYVTDKVSSAVLTRRIPDRVLQASWPSGCCVCGAPATRTETVTRKWILGPEGVGRDRELTVKAEGVPYCDEHRDGVEFASIPGERGRFLKFRSYAYQTKFRRTNEWARRVAET